MACKKIRILPYIIHFFYSSATEDDEAMPKRIYIRKYTNIDSQT